MTSRTSTRIRTYSEFKRKKTFEERWRYLSLHGNVGDATFGFDRYLNQMFYTSREWRRVRQHIIVRDNGCDLGIPGYEIHRNLVIHHLNPMTVEDILDANPANLDPEFLITTTHMTHNAIHYGDERLLPQPFVPRQRGDTTLW